MENDKVLERTWDASYPEESGAKLWPGQPVPMVEFAKHYFVPGSAILDLPCGDGKNVFSLSETGPVVAADWSERAVELCNEARRDTKTNNIAVMKADVFQTPFADDSFESIFCCDLLGHLPQADLALQELRRIVAPSGTLIATVFSIRDSVLEDNRMRRTEDGAYWFQDKWFFRFYTSDTAKALCEAAGFKVLAIEEYSWWEEPHPGYREYRHRHSSYALALRKSC